MDFGIKMLFLYFREIKLGGGSHQVVDKNERREIQQDNKYKIEEYNFEQDLIIKQIYLN